MSNMIPNNFSELLFGIVKFATLIKIIVVISKKQNKFVGVCFQTIITNPTEKCLESLSNCCKMDELSVLHANGEFTISEFSKNRQRSLRYILESKGPIMDPCGTLSIILLRELYCELILTRWSQSDRELLRQIENGIVARTSLASERYLLFGPYSPAVWVQSRIDCQIRSLVTMFCIVHIHFFKENTRIYHSSIDLHAFLFCQTL